MWHHAGVMLATATQTAISDAARMAILTHLAARPGTTWVRVVRPPCCARCAILAGKKGSSSMRFLRHPGCDCTAIPVSEATSDMHKLFYFDAKEYFDSLAPEQQAKVFTKAGAKAIQDGADINQVVNARRGMKAITSAGGRRRLITTEGTTKRGWASEYLREQYGAVLAEADEITLRDPEQAERFFGNRITYSAGSWLPAGLWEEHYAMAWKSP